MVQKIDGYLVGSCMATIFYCHKSCFVEFVFGQNRDMAEMGVIKLQDSVIWLMNQ